MQMIMDNTRGLTLLVGLNWDRLLYLATVLAALLAGVWVGTLGVQ